MDKFSRRETDDIFLFSPEIRPRHFMQSVILGNLHEISKPIFPENTKKKKKKKKKKKYFKISSAEILASLLSVKKTVSEHCRP